MSVLLGNGDGTFRPAVTYGTSVEFYSGVLGDFNRDGKMDVALTSNNGIYVFLGNGDGTFGAPTIVGSSTGYPNGYSNLVAADFNLDGKLDLLATFAAGVSIFMSNGDGTFQPALTVPMNGVGFSSLTVADMNSDGVPDIITFTGGYQ
jgi:hypothetical protein